MNEQIMRAFADEMETIQKEAGIGSFLASGFKGLGTVGKRSLSQHGDILKKLWARGQRGGGGTWGSIKQIAKSPYGRMGAAAGLTGLAGYGAYKATLGRDRRRQQQY
jgi:hypothetical protein